MRKRLRMMVIMRYLDRIWLIWLVLAKTLAMFFTWKWSVCISTIPITYYSVEIGMPRGMMSAFENWMFSLL